MNWVEHWDALNEALIVWIIDSMDNTIEEEIE